MDHASIHNPSPFDFVTCRTARSDFSQFHTGERGMFLPLAALILAGIVSLLFAAGVDTTLVRITRSSLQSIANTVCSSLANQAMTPDFAALGFKQGVESLQDQIGFGRLTNATLIMSLPSEAPLNSVDPARICSEEDMLSLSDSVTALPAGGEDSPAFGLFKEFDESLKCNFSGNPSLDCTLWAYPNMQLPAGIPDSYQEALLPGRGVGCSLSADVDSYSFKSAETTSVTAQAVYSMLHFSRRAVNSPNNPLGLRVAISTQMTTPPLHLISAPSHEFPIRDFPLTFGAVVRAQGSSEGLDYWITNYDPLCAPPLLEGGDWCSDYRKASLAFPIAPSLLSLGHLRAFSGPRPIEPKTESIFERGGETLSSSQREELLIGCMNPPVLIRNIVASSLVSLAARDPVLRRHTEILHINPLDVAAFSTATGNESVSLRHSTVLVPMGIDITRRAFQLPLVTFRQDPIFDGTGTTLYSGIGVADPGANLSSGEVYPLSDADLMYSDNDQIVHAELADQLRRCLHLYTGLTDGANDQKEFRGIDMFGDSRLVSSPFGLLRSDQNGGFQFNPVLYPGTGNDIPSQGRYRGTTESGDGRKAYELDPETSGYTAGVTAQPQGPEETWNSIPPSGLNSSRLSAMELVSILGTSQRCPYTSIGGPGGTPLCPSTTSPGGNERSFSKDFLYANQEDLSGNQGFELTPDYFALIAPLIDPSDIKIQNPEPYLRIPKTVELPNQQRSFTGSVKCREAALVVITHQLGVPVTPTVLNTALNARHPLSLFHDEEQRRESPLIIIAIPTISSVPDPTILKDQVFDDNLGNDPNASVLVFAPAGCLDGAADTACTDAEFHKYWGEILNPDSPNYVVTSIREFFTERLNQGYARKTL